MTSRPNNIAPSTQRARCEASRRDECRVQQAGAERGRRAFNLTAVRACLEAQFPQASCLRNRNLALTACDVGAFTIPLAAPGALCTASEECAGGTCSIVSGLCGQCVPFANPDGGAAPCGAAAACAPGTFCRAAAGPDLCAPQGGADAGCSSTNECRSGFVCPNTGSRTCTLGKLEGETCIKGRTECFRSSSTDFELLCATGPLFPDGGADRCVKRFNTTAGGFCNTSETGAGIPTGPSCLDTEYCNNGLCEPRRAAPQPCGTNTEVCQAGARCVQGICTPYGDVGASCSSNDQCKALLYCAGATMGSMGTCQALFSVAGGLCINGAFPSCTSASYCPGTGMQTCVGQKPNGQVCMTSVECLNGSCNGACGNACWR